MFFLRLACQTCQNVKPHTTQHRNAHKNNRKITGRRTLPACFYFPVASLLDLSLLSIFGSHGLAAASLSFSKPCPAATTPSARRGAWPAPLPAVAAAATLAAAYSAMRTRPARRLEPTLTAQARAQARAARSHLLLLPTAPHGLFYAKAHDKNPRQCISSSLGLPLLLPPRASPRSRRWVALLLLLGATTGHIERRLLRPLLPLLLLLVVGSDRHPRLPLLFVTGKA